MRSLTLDPAIDRERFDAVGQERAATLLAAVMGAGQTPEATASDWESMHRAVDGLVELYRLHDDVLRAAMFAGIQALLYENYDGDLARALPAAQQALELKRAVPGTPNIAIEYGALGRLLLTLGRARDAAAALRAAREHEEDPLSRTATIHWRLLVQAVQAAGGAAEARHEAEAFNLLAASGSPSMRLNAALALAEVDEADEQFDAALDHVREARAIATGQPERETLDLEIGATLAGLILDASRSLPYDEALSLAGRIDRDFKGLTIEITPIARAVIRTRRRLAGEFDAILREDIVALAAARATQNLGEQVDALRTLASTYANLNAWQEAAALLSEALPLARADAAAAGASGKVQTRALLSAALALGNADVELGELAAARQAFAEVTTRFTGIKEAALQRSVAEPYARAWLGLARVAALNGRAQDAIKILTDALAGQPAEARFDRPDVLARLARVERQVDPPRAIEHYEAAIEGWRADKDRSSELQTRLQLVEFLAATPAAGADRVARARGHLALAAAAAGALNVADAQWRVHYVEGLLLETEGKPADAIAAYAAGADRLDRVRAGLGGAEQRAALVDAEAVQDLYGRLAALESRAGHTERAWDAIERGKARAFLDALGGRRFATAAASPASDTLRALEQRIVSLRTLLSPEFAGVRGVAGRDSRVAGNQLEELERQFLLERTNAAVTASRATQPLSARPITLQEVRRRLPARTALIEYALQPAGMSAFVVTAEGGSELSWTADASTLRQSVAELRELWSDPAAGGNVEQAAARVGGAVLPAALLERIPRGVEHLIVVPVDVLTYLPFDALPISGGRQLIDRFAVSYLPSASTLQFLDSAPPAAGGSLFLGALGNARVEEMPPLPGTLTETDAVLKEFPAAVRKSEAAFTRDSAIDALQHYDRVHFATHGLLDEHAPIFSAILMGATHDGPTRLSLYEIAAVRVRARLVVLSACETGLGLRRRGDEVTGLTRTFLQAGASSVVSSLWSVSDDSTAFLMGRFYAELKAGALPSRALRTAALATRQQFGHPFFWAPFVLTGVQ